MWKITKDEYNKDVDIKSVDYAKNVELTEEFRLLDGDSNQIYTGFSNDSQSEDAFAPLDDYGMPNDGCVSIEYMNKTTGEWEEL